MEWAKSKTVGRMTEVTLFTPIRQGFIPGEGRTYEQRLAGALESVQQRVLDGVPTPIGVMPTIHFARWLILRPAQYLQYSVVDPDAKKNPTLHSWLFFESNFDGELKDYLRERREGDFLDNLCRKLLSYALGRSLQASDRSTLQEMPCSTGHGD